MSLYDEVVGLSKPYLGMATEKFVARQCEQHVKVSPQQLSRAELPELARWMEISGGMIMDKTKAKELAARILAL